MTDREKVALLFRELMLKYKEDELSLRLDEESMDRISGWQGYSGFFFWFEFDKNGKFEAIGAAE